MNRIVNRIANGKILITEVFNNISLAQILHFSHNGNFPSAHRILNRYVVEKDAKNNVVFVSRNYYSFDKRRRLFRAGSLKWLSGSPPSLMNQLQCKVRHGPGFYNCSLTMECGEDGHEVAVVQISEDDQGLAAGQFTAFYEGRTCIGSGVIMESCDDQGFPVCAKALEIAGMRDKSILGKPVKIMVKQEACPKESEHKGCIPTAVLMKQDQCFDTN